MYNVVPDSSRTRQCCLPSGPGSPSNMMSLQPVPIAIVFPTEAHYTQAILSVSHIGLQICVHVIFPAVEIFPLPLYSGNSVSLKFGSKTRRESSSGLPGVHGTLIASNIIITSPSHKL